MMGIIQNGFHELLILGFVVNVTINMIVVVAVCFVFSVAHADTYPLSTKELRAIQSEQFVEFYTKMGASRDVIVCVVDKLSKIPDSQLRSAYEYERKHGEFPGWWRKNLGDISKTCDVRTKSRKVEFTEIEARMLEIEELRELSRKYGLSKSAEACLIRESNATPGSQILQDWKDRFANNKSPPLSFLNRIDRMAALCGNR